MSTTYAIDNTQDIIDSREVIERINELRGNLASLSPDELSELWRLESLAEQAKDSPDWEHGEQLIRSDYFVTYIEELIWDCYPIPQELNSGTWPYNHMQFDFEAAAQDAKVDYMAVSFAGVEYLIRA